MDVFETPVTQNISVPCTAGYYLSDTGCVQCSVNMYSEAGATQCTYCPDGKQSDAGSKSLMDCTWSK